MLRPGYLLDKIPWRIVDMAYLAVLVATQADYSTLPDIIYLFVILPVGSNLGSVLLVDSKYSDP